MPDHRAPPPTIPASSDHFYTSDFFVLRTPLLPFHDFADWGRDLAAPGAHPSHLASALAADGARLRERLRSLLEQPEIAEAIFLASPPLSAALAAWRRHPAGKRQRRAELASIRYVTRMASRSTPFGLCAGWSIGWLSAEGSQLPRQPTRLTLAARGSYRRHSRLDMDHVSALCDKLARDADLQPRLRYRPNSSLYEAAGDLRYAEARLDGLAKSYRLVSMGSSPYIRAALERASGGAAVDDLVEAVIAAHADLHPRTPLRPAVARVFVSELVDYQVLVPDLHPPLTGPEPLTFLVERLGERGHRASGVLAGVARRLAALDAAGLGAQPERYGEVAAELAALPLQPDMARLVQVDMWKPAIEAVVGEDVVREVARGLDLMLRIAGQPAAVDLDRFRADFGERYGEREVPLTEALDGELGVGFGLARGAAASPSPLLAGLDLDRRGEAGAAWRARDGFLLSKVLEARHEGPWQLELADADFARMARLARGRAPRLPDAFDVMVKVAASSPAALARGEFALLLCAAGGPSGIRSMGRFCHADAALAERVEAHLRAEERCRPDALFAEIVHSSQGRLGNVVLRPAMRAYEIPYLGVAGAPVDRQIPVTDLLLSRKGGRLVLRSRRLDREIVPRLSCAHAFPASSLTTYRFLCSLQAQDVVGGLAWSWGALDDLPFLPRVTSGRLVLARAAWLLTGEQVRAWTAGDAAARFAAVQAWRGRQGLPRFVTAESAGPEMLVDLDNCLSIEALLDLVRGAARVKVRECFPGPHQLVVRGPEGGFVHEMVIPFVRRSAAARDPATARQAASAGVVGTRPCPGRRRQLFAPGSEWLLVRYFGGGASCERLLLRVLGPFVRRAAAAGMVDCWFFQRSQEGVQLQLHGDPAVLTRDVLAALHQAAAPCFADGAIWRAVVDTYDVDRWWPTLAAGCRHLHRMFQADSEAALQILAALGAAPPAGERWRAASRGVAVLLTDFALDRVQRIAVLQAAHQQATADAARPAPRREPPRREVRIELDARRRKAASRSALPVADILARRSTGLSAALAALRAEVPAAAGEDDWKMLAMRMVRAHVNRLSRAPDLVRERRLYRRLVQARRSERRRGGNDVRAV